MELRSSGTPAQRSWLVGGGRRCLPAEMLDTGWRWLAQVWDDAVWPAAGVGSYEVENIMSSGQGKFPLEVVTDNNLLRQRYENDELEGKLPLYVTTTSAQGVVKVGDLSQWLSDQGVRARRFVIQRTSPSNTQGSLTLPCGTVSVSINYRQGSGAASTGSALKFIVGATSKDEAAYRLSVAGKHNRIVIGQRRTYMIDSLPVKRIDWQSVSAETGSSDLIIDVDVLRPVKAGTDVVLAPMAQLSTDAAIYDESGYETHGSFDPGLTASAAAANAGYLTTGASTVASEGASFPASIFNSVNPNTDGQYILRFTMDAAPPAANGQQFAGTIDAGGAPPDGITWNGWTDGRVACRLRLSGVSDSEYAVYSGLLVSGVEHHYSVFVDRSKNQFSAWIDNTPIIISRDIAGKSIHTTGRLRLGNDTTSRSMAAKFRGLRLINAAGMSYDDALGMVEIMNLMHS